jgi:hypothetical protein
MAGRHAAARGSLFKVTRMQSCAIDITIGAQVGPTGALRRRHIAHLDRAKAAELFREP